MREEIQFSAPTAHLPGADMQPKSPGGLCGSAVPWSVQVQVGPEAKISRAGEYRVGRPLSKSRAYTCPLQALAALWLADVLSENGEELGDGTEGQRWGQA